MDYQVYKLSGLTQDVGDERLLDENERIAYAKRGLPFLLIRSLLKRELARRLGCCAQDVHFRISPHGKPFVPDTDCHFNISHSGDYLVMAFHHRPVGVDVERHRPRRVASLAARFMSQDQLQAFRSRNCPQQEFFDCWCATEALVKHAASSIWHALSFPYLYDKGCVIPQFSNAPHIELFCPADGYSAAIAY